jgi:hypothetical protein
MPKTPIKKAAKRKNLSKEEIARVMTASEANAHVKEIIEKIFPHLEGLDSIYDAQTVVNALSGFISAHIEEKLLTIKLNEIKVDLSKEEDSKIKTAVLKLEEIFQDEKAKTLSSILDRFGRTLAEYGANKFLKEPMSTITLKDILA